MTKYLDKEGLKKVWNKMTAYADGQAQSVREEINGVIDLETGIIKPSALPSYVDDIMEFGGMVEGVTVKQMSTTTFEKVVYHKTLNIFVAMKTVNMKAEYYGNWSEYSDPETGRLWPGGDSYGDTDSATSGWKPKTGKIYVDTVGNEAYRWSGSMLVSIGSDTLTDAEIEEVCK